MKENNQNFSRITAQVNSPKAKLKWLRPFAPVVGVSFALLQIRV